MTEKDRYEYWKESDTAYDTKRKYGQYFHIIDKKECVDLLNELSKENEWLKKSIKRQQLSNEECSKYIEEVVKENEQLKERISELKFLLELAKLHTEIAEGKMDKFVELKLE